MERGRRWLRCGGLIALAFFFTIPTAAGQVGAETEPPLIIDQAANGAVAVSIPTSELDLVLDVVASGTEPVEGVRVDMSRLRVVGTNNVADPTLLLDEEPFDPDTEAFDLVPGVRRGLTLQASLPRPGLYQGTISLLVDNQRIVTDLDVTFDEPPLAFDQGIDGAIEVAVDSGEFDLTLRLVPTGLDDATGVSVDVEQLTIVGTTVSAPVELTVLNDPVDSNGGLIDVPVRGGRHVRLTTTLPRPGVYSGALIVRQAGAETRTSLKITYGDPPAPTVAIDPIGVVRGESFEVTVRETGHRRVVLDRPTLSSVRRSLSDTVEEAVVLPDVTMKQVVGGNLLPVEDMLVLEANASITLRITIHDLDTAGEYEADLRFASGGAEEGVSAAVQILRRSSMWLVALPIVGLGILAAELIRRLVVQNRPRLEAQRLIADWSARAQRVVSDLPDLERIQRDVQHAISLIERQLAVLGGSVAAGELSLAEAKTATAGLQDRLVMLEFMATVLVDAGDAGVLDDAHTDVALLVGYVGHGTPDKAIAETALARITQRTDSGVSKELARTLIARLTGHAGRVPQTAEDARSTAETRAKEALTHLEASSFAEARISFDAAREGWTKAVTSILSDRIGPDPAVGRRDAKWDALVEQAIAALAKPTENIEQDAKQVFNDYVSQMVDRIEAAAKELPESDDTDETKPHRVRLAEAVAAARRAVLHGSALAAVRHSDVAMDELKQLTPTPLVPPPRGGAQRRELDRLGIESQVELTAIGGTRPTDPHRVSEPNLEKFRRKLQTLDAAVTLFSILVTIAIGVALLYSPNLSWGSTDDKLALLLWGLGVHQIAGVSGSIAIRNSVRSGLIATE